MTPDADGLSQDDALHREWAARREERKPTNWIAMIRLPDGTEIPTTVKDISTSGARLAVPRSYALPERFLFKVVGRDFVCAVALAWRRDDFVGVRIERVGKLPVTKAEPAASKPDGSTSGLRARRSDFSRF